MEKVKGVFWSIFIYQKFDKINSINLYIFYKVYYIYISRIAIKDPVICQMIILQRHYYNKLKYCNILINSYIYNNYNLNFIYQN